MFEILAGLAAGSTCPFSRAAVAFARGIEGLMLPRGSALRARIILACAESAEVRKVAAACGTNIQTVYRIRAAFPA